MINSNRFNSKELFEVLYGKAYLCVEGRLSNTKDVDVSYVFERYGSHYHHFTFLPFSTFFYLLQRYVGLIRKLLCPHPWIQAQHLSGLVAHPRLEILHCPTIFLHSSLLGYTFRCYGESVATWRSNTSSLSLLHATTAIPRAHTGSLPESGPSSARI